MDAKTAYEIAKTIPRTNESAINLSVFYNDDGTLNHVSVFNHGVMINNDYFDKIDGVRIYVYDIGQKEEESFDEYKSDV